MTIVLSSASGAVRERWRQILQVNYQLLEACSGLDIQKIIRQQAVDLILLHRSMVDLEFLGKMKDSRFFVFSDLPDDSEAYTILKGGAVGYANTYISAARLQEAVQVALAGRVWVGQKLMQKIIRATTRSQLSSLDGVPALPEHNLSEREWEVAICVSKGLANLEIASELAITERTVKAHISAIFKKTRTESRLQIALHVKNLLAGNGGSLATG